MKNKDKYCMHTFKLLKKIHIIHVDTNSQGHKDKGVKSKRKKQDEILDVYSLYLETGLEWIKEEAILKAYELHLLDKRFHFEI